MRIDKEADNRENLRHINKLPRPKSASATMTRTSHSSEYLSGEDNLRGTAGTTAHVTQEQLSSAETKRIQLHQRASNEAQQEHGSTSREPQREHQIDHVQTFNSQSCINGLQDNRNRSPQQPSVLYRVFVNGIGWGSQVSVFKCFPLVKLYCRSCASVSKTVNIA